jgi:DME family drug/metabolite transporter
VKGARLRTVPALGYAEALLAAGLWGTSGIFATYLFRAGMSSASVALLRPLWGGVFLAIGALAWRRDVLRIPTPGLVSTVLIGGTATAVFQLSYQMSTARAGVPVTAALLYLAPAMVLAASGPLLGERPGKARTLFAAISVLGVWIAVLSAGRGQIRVHPADIGWGVLAGSSYAAYTLFGRYAAPRWGSMETVLFSTLGAAAMLLLVLPWLGGPVRLPPNTGAWTLLLVFSFLTISVAAFLFYDALGRVEAGSVSVAATVEPVVATLLATALLGQAVGGWGWFGLLLVVGGVAGSYRVTAPAKPKTG